MRTILKYPGSKWNIASKLVELIPEHHSYVEPFFGSGAVLFNKPVSDIETINDLDHDVVNLFRCIQEDAEHLSRMVMVTPFSREKYEDTYKKDMSENTLPDEPYYKALRFLIQCWQGHGFRTNGYKVGWKIVSGPASAGNAGNHEWLICIGVAFIFIVLARKNNSEECDDERREKDDNSKK